VVLAVSLGLAQPASAWAQSAPAPANQTQASAQTQAGQRISLDLKGVDILDVLKLLSQKSGLNFVAGRNVSGRVTIFVNDVNVWDAFELIIGANDLAYERKGSIITVMMARDYELLYGEKFQERKANFVQPLKYAKVVQVATVLNQVKSSIGRVVADEATNTIIVSDVPGKLEEMKALLAQLDRPTETRVYNLNYTEAEKLKEKLQPLLSPIGSFTFDARTNKAIITDLKEILASTDRVIRAFDVPDGQVLIEAKIISVTLTDSMSLGIDWKQVFAGIDTAARSNFDEISGSIVDAKSATEGGSAPKGGGIQLLYSKLAANVIIEALRSVGNTETLSNPRIMVSNNQEARILVGTKEAFITSSTTVTATGPTQIAPEVKFEDVRTQLFVPPNVKRDGPIQLKIRPEVSSVARTDKTVTNTVVPIIQTTEAETNVLVKSGVTLIIAGLIDTKDERNDEHIPWLGKLPVVGALFRGMTTTKKKTELVVLLTPQIILPDGAPYIVPPELSAADAASANVALQDPVPPSYSKAVRQRLQEHMASQFRAASLPSGSVAVSFVLSHDGKLARVGELTSPQGEQFVAVAKAALEQAQPFPPFPAGSQAEEVRFRLTVDYSP
jgi:type II secretory pathway component GspD/PulD (secretin)